MRKLLLLVLLFTHSFLFAERLTVGTLSFGPPFELLADNDGHFFGFDIDLMLETCKRIEAECRFTALSFEELFTQTLSGRIDLAIASISITEDRKLSYLFSNPYLPSSGQFLAKNTSSVTTINDLSGKKIGLERGTIFKGVIQQQFGSSVEIVEFSQEPDLLQALYSGDIDALILDTGSAQYWAASDSQYRLVGPPIFIGIGYGIMANKSRTELINRINIALASMQKDGTYQKIYGRYFTHPI